MNTVHPKKLLMTKWTAVQPIARQKHFIVTKVIEIAEPQDMSDEGAREPPRTTPKIEWIEIEAVHSRAVRRIPWRELRDTAVWRQGWI